MVEGIYFCGDLSQYATTFCIAFIFKEMPVACMAPNAYMLLSSRSYCFLLKGHKHIKAKTCKVIDVKR